VAGEQQPDVLVAVAESVWPPPVQIQRTRVLLLHVQLERQHRPGHPVGGAASEQRPPRLGAEGEMLPRGGKTRALVRSAPATVPPVQPGNLKTRWCAHLPTRGDQGDRGVVRVGNVDHRGGDDGLQYCATSGSACNVRANSDSCPATRRCGGAGTSESARTEVDHLRSPITPSAMTAAAPRYEQQRHNTASVGRRIPVHLWRRQRRPTSVTWPNVHRRPGHTRTHGAHPRCPNISLARWQPRCSPSTGAAGRPRPWK